VPSTLIGASYGFIQWHGQRGVYSFAGSEEVRWDLVNAQPTTAYRSKIGRLDHVATRLAARDRDEAILEFIRLTNHHYKFSIYVESLNSITNVTRRSERDVGLVFTSGIGQYVSDEVSGPTEKFVHNYGPRTHHMAFDTQDIEWTFGRLKEDGMEFMIELVGGPTEGLHQTFTQPSAGTLIVNEYIHRYNGFTGYFTLSNVTALTQATAKQ
jgi:4-hydroxyphenylpyruvate dioxygenase-like putative hemolysin